LEDRPQLPTQPVEAKGDEEMTFDLPQEEDELDVSAPVTGHLECTRSGWGS